MQIGVIGLGRMGGNMSRRLIKNGHEVVVYDHDAKAVAAQTSDMVADPDAGIEPAADLDQHRICRCGAKAVVDRAHIIDADRKEHRVARRTPVRGDSRESVWSISVGRRTSGAEPTRTWQNWSTDMTRGGDKAR